MPPPGTVEELFGVVEKSRLVNAKTLGNYRERVQSQAETPAKVVEQMVQDGVLTPFQSSLLLEGKTRPFFVGPYKVLSKLGAGMMGVVYLCEHVAMRRKVALKVLQTRRQNDNVAVQRFLREARAAAALNHPNVVQALDLGLEGEMYYLSMEYVEGSSLLELVRNEGKLEPLKVADYLRQAAAGLEHAHNAGLIHRDIKPSNVMVGRDGNVKLLDLGLARFADCEENLTQGAPLGTLGFVAPEQSVNGHNADFRSDIYSLGATYYFALTGKAPDPRKPIRPSAKPKSLDLSDYGRLKSILEKMLYENPDDRYQSITEVINEIDLWLHPTKPLMEGSQAEVPEEVEEEEVEFPAYHYELTEAPPLPPPLPVLVNTPAPAKRLSVPEQPPFWKEICSPTPSGGVKKATTPSPKILNAPGIAWVKWGLAITLASFAGFMLHSVINAAKPRPEPPRLSPRSTNPNAP